MLAGFRSIPYAPLNNPASSARYASLRDERLRFPTLPTYFHSSLSIQITLRAFNLLQWIFNNSNQLNEPNNSRTRFKASEIRDRVAALECDTEDLNDDVGNGLRLSAPLRVNFLRVITRNYVRSLGLQRNGWPSVGPANLHV